MPKIVFRPSCPIPNAATICTKRNILVGQSGGDVIVQFDDDDLYRQQYTAVMVDRLDGNVLNKLSVWNARSERDGSIWRCDARRPATFAVHGSNSAMRIPPADTSPEATEATLWGYGFSYVYPRAAWACCPFDDLNLGEGRSEEHTAEL